MYNLDLLTNDAKFLLASMYKEYIVRRKNKVAKIKAMDFWDIEQIHKIIMKDWSLDDIPFGVSVVTSIVVFWINYWLTKQFLK
ncbi:hypothetical protein DVK09_09715 [Listeria monocytogenes]|nr:hypothetical protein [Listeria monocytogenes]MCR81069.1 hypothetical protein [Listeria monocytogenes]